MGTLQLVKEVALFEKAVKEHDIESIRVALYRIHSIISSNPWIRGDETTKLFFNALGMLKTNIYTSVKSQLFSGQTLSEGLIEVSELVSKKYSSELRKYIVNHIMKGLMSQYRVVVDFEQNDLQNLEYFFEWYHKTILYIQSTYNNFPSTWGLESIFTYSFCIHTKNYITLALIHKTHADKLIISAVDKCIEFEKTYARAKLENKCCTKTGINFERDEINIDEHTIECQHWKMLSRCFLPEMGVYAASQAQKMNVTKFTSATKMCIYECFIEFVSKINEIGSNLSYISDSHAYSVFIMEIEKILIGKLQQFNQLGKKDSVLINLNSLIYLSNALKEYIYKIEQVAHITCTIQSLEIVRKLELNAVRQFEEVILGKLSTTNLSKVGEAMYVTRMIEKLSSSGFDEYLDELRDIIADSLFSVLFSKISLIRQTTSRAELLLVEYSTIKEYTKEILPLPPIADIIERYLKVFIIDASETELFIENYYNFSGGIFKFSQMLNILEDKGNNVNLFFAYRNRQKSIFENGNR